MGCGSSHVHIENSPDISRMRTPANVRVYDLRSHFVPEDPHSSVARKQSFVSMLGVQ